MPRTASLGLISWKSFLEHVCGSHVELNLERGYFSIVAVDLRRSREVESCKQLYLVNSRQLAETDEPIDKRSDQLSTG